MILTGSNTGRRIRNLTISFFRFWGGQISTLTTGQIWMLIDTSLPLTWVWLAFLPAWFDDC